MQVLPLANLISTFIQTAAKPSFISSQFHSALFRYHALGEEGLLNPGSIPYYTNAFFLTIKKVQKKSPLNPMQMTVGQWYRYELKERVSMDEDKEGRREKRCRVEELELGMDCRRSFSLARL